MRKQSFFLDNRGVSAVIGFVLIFGILVTAYAIYQGTVIPAQNKNVEFKHSEKVTDQIVKLRNDAQNTGSTGESHSSDVKLGADYPPRILGINWAQSSGALTFNGGKTVSLKNVSAVNSETRDYLNESLNYSTGNVQYRVEYTRYQQEPTIFFENSIVYTRYPSGTSIRTGQSLINNRTINLVTLEGEISEGGVSTVSVDFTSVSSSRTSVPIEPQGGNLTLVIATELPAEKWRQVLSEERNDGIVTDITQKNPQNVAITLKKNETYTLRVSRVSVNQQTSQPRPAYITSENQNITIEAGSTTELTAQVRDGFNNPRQNVNTSATAVSGSVNKENKLSNSNGEVTYRYTAPSNSGDDTVNISIEGKSGRESFVNYNITVTSRGGTGGGTRNGSGNGTDVGRGGEDNWTRTSNTTWLADEGGRWTNVGNADSISLSDPILSVLDPSTDRAVEGRRYFKSVITVTDGNTSYHLVVGAQPQGVSGGNPGRGGNVDGLAINVPQETWESRKVSLYRNTNTSASNLFEGETLKVSELDAWREGTDGLNLLQANEYDNPATVRSGLDSLSSFMKNNTVTVYFEKVHGGANITIE